MAIMDNLNQNTAERIRETENLLGKNDISDIADGTVTGAIVEFGGSIKETTENTLPGSIAGGLRIIEIAGDSVQDGTPTPDNPQEIKSVGNGGNLEIKTTGKNMFNPESNDYITGLTVDKNNMVYKANATLAGTRIYYLPCKPNTQYSYSKTVGATVRLMSCAEIPANGATITVVKEVSGNSVSITTGKNDKYIAIYPLFSTELESITWESVLDSIQIEIGSVTDFERYQAITISIPLSESLKKHDKILERGGFFEAFRNAKKTTFNGSESWVASGALVGRYGIVLDGKATGSCVCTIATNGSNGSNNLNECFINQNGDFYINTGFETLDAWKAYLAENPIDVEYELANPIFEQFDSEVQIALNSLVTYDGITTIAASGEVAPIIRFEYGKNKVGAYTLKSLLDAEICKIKLEEINKALPYAISINDEAKTIDFIDR